MATETPKQERPQLVNFTDIDTGERFPDAYELFVPDELESYQQLAPHLYLFKSQNGFALRISCINTMTVRFRYAHEGHFAKDFSYALVAPTPTLPWQEVHEAPDYISLTTSHLECRIYKSDLKVAIYTLDGKLLCKDNAPVSIRRTILKGIDQVKVSKSAAADESHFGLGDKSCPSNMRGHQLQNWNTDAFGYGEETDPLYRSVPFYYSLSNGNCYGIFFHNTYRTHFDFAKNDQDSTQFWADGGEIDYFFLYGESPLEVGQSYTSLTGLPEMPPIWALGFHQCRWSYFPEKRVYEIAKEFRERQIPCDSIYLDIDYMDAYRCFTWNEEYFPEPHKMIADLKEQGFHTVVMIDPGIRVDPDYHVYKDGIEKDVFCYRSTGEIMRGPVWPPDCVFPDFTKAITREWWGQLYKKLYNEQGVSGFWNDMNEPAVFKVDCATFPDHVLHDFDGHGGDHRKAHNIYGLQMSRASYQGLKQLQADKRPFLLTRATFSGGQRYASAWTGDNIATWEHLRLANIQCQRMSISGFSFIGTDIGGFSGQPDGELLVRWLQLGVFHPFYRVHSMGNNVDGAAEADADTVHEAERANRMDQEPWAFGEEYTILTRKAIEFRYQLLPYLYTAFWQHITSGDPILKPLFFDYPDDEKAVTSENEFLFGEQLLVMPVMEAKAEKVKGYLPKGQWYDYWTGQAYEGGKEISIKTQAEYMPLFAKAGAIIPNYPVMQYTGEKAVDKLYLRVYHGSLQNNKLYEDAGDGYDYQKEVYSLRQFETDGTNERLLIKQIKKGTYISNYDHIEIQLVGMPAMPVSCVVDDQEVEILENDGLRSVEVKADFTSIEIRF